MEQRMLCPEHGNCFLKPSRCQFIGEVVFSVSLALSSQNPQALIQPKSGGPEAVFMQWGIPSSSDACTSLTVYCTYCTLTEKSCTVGEGFPCRWWMRILWMYSALLKRGGAFFFFYYILWFYCWRVKTGNNVPWNLFNKGRDCHSCAEVSKILFLCRKHAPVVLKTLY